MLTQRAKYGLRAMSLLAGASSPGSTISIPDLAERGRIPPKFLETILLDLRRHGFVASRRGKAGGYSLARRPTEIAVGDLIRALDGPLAPIPCASLTAYRPCADCLDAATCEIRILMRRVRDAMSGILDHTSLADLVAEGSLPGHDDVMPEKR